MKSSTQRPRILLDTCYILPTLGIDLGDIIKANIEALEGSDVEIYYSHLSILESLWVATKIQKGKFDSERFTLGLRSIIEGGGYKRLEEDSEILTEALELYSLGHKDMIDNILYAHAARLHLTLLTEDEELKKFIRENNLDDVF